MGCARARATAVSIYVLNRSSFRRRRLGLGSCIDSPRGRRVSFRRETCHYARDLARRSFFFRSRGFITIRFRRVGASSSTSRAAGFFLNRRVEKDARDGSRSSPRRAAFANKRPPRAIVRRLGSLGVGVGGKVLHRPSATEVILSASASGISTANLLHGHHHLDVSSESSLRSASRRCAPAFARDFVEVLHHGHHAIGHLGRCRGTRRRTRAKPWGARARGARAVCA